MTPQGLKEIFKLQNEMDVLLAKEHISKEERKRCDIIMSKIASLRDMGMSTDEAHRALAAEYGREVFSDFHADENQKAHEDLFRRYLRGEDIDSTVEQRTLPLMAGTQSIVYTQGQAGGFLVPTQFREAAVEGMAAVDPLLDANVVTLVQEPTFQLRPLSIPGWDLSTVRASKIGETVSYDQDVAPVLNTELLNKWTYRIGFDATLEWDEDAKAYGDPLRAMGRATGIALARGIGLDLVEGNGSTAPASIVHGATDSGYMTASDTALTIEDFSNVFFSVNRVYREAPKCAWLVNDAVAKLIRNAKDNNNRPLFPTEDDVVKIFGKPVYVCPNLPTINPSVGPGPGDQFAGSFCVFGDLSKYIVHTSSILLRRQLQVPGLIEYGKCRYLAMQMVDATVDDPTNGSVPPIVSARLFHS